jgi:16S rRNA (guanine966-N2)-methyltransferase
MHVIQPVSALINEVRSQSGIHIMRVISGSARGRRLKGPPSSATRPMADKIKGALFNALLSLGIEPERVLDLYAGTGNIGIEALSRGATSADFVDQGREQCAVIRENLATTGFASVSRVHQASVVSFIQQSRTGPYDFVILDPPYAAPDIIDTLEALSASSLVQSGTIVVLGHWPRLDLPDTIGRLECLRHRCHGDSCFSVYEVVDTDSSSDSDPVTEPGDTNAQ